MAAYAWPPACLGLTEGLAHQCFAQLAEFLLLFHAGKTADCRFSLASYSTVFPIRLRLCLCIGDLNPTVSRCCQPPPCSAIDLCTNTLITDIGMNGIGEIDCVAPLGRLISAPFGVKQNT